ncbi:MAG TPA: spore maturation protein A [Candidatus Acutalibacter pullicola]|uniref:Spore maturation protein A n=1 Tax=Candidatus Acutalibacter pullicola TaxID=2838417 RepID=A0A9D2MU17_9FIRM|nr:spore maturation protein A [Candidatus Acutalibacter pullicola]
MLNSIWFGMMAASILCAAATGRLGELSTALLEGAQNAVEFSILLLGSMCVWLGFLQVAEESGLSRLFARLLSPVIRRLFPEYGQDLEVQGKISMNLSANLLGLGNAATPLGLAAMEAMKEKNPGQTPTRGMILFVVMNTASLQLIPMNMAAMRAANGSVEPFGILPEIWLTSAASLAVSLAACKLLERHWVWNR